MSEVVGKREIAYRIFSTTPGIIEKQHEDSVLAAFTSGFKDADVTVGTIFTAFKNWLIR